MQERKPVRDRRCFAQWSFSAPRRRRRYGFGVSRSFQTASAERCKKVQAQPLDEMRALHSPTVPLARTLVRARSTSGSHLAKDAPAAQIIEPNFLCSPV